jgi:hypothetical protein
MDSGSEVQVSSVALGRSDEGLPASSALDAETAQAAAPTARKTARVSAKTLLRMVEAII